MLVVAQTVERFGRIDTLFNNAGVLRAGPIDEFTDEDWHLVIDTSLHATFYMARAVLRVMRIQGTGGSIVNMASDAGLQGYRNFGAYGAAKAGIIHLTRVMALETAEQNIRVTVICPGDIDTPIQEDGYASMGGRDDGMAAIASTIPMKRMGRSEEIARTVMFMASDAASFATGSVYSVDGGAAAGREFVESQPPPLG